MEHRCSRPFGVAETGIGIGSWRRHARLQCAAVALRALATVYARWPWRQDWLLAMMKKLTALTVPLPLLPPRLEGPEPFWELQLAPPRHRTAQRNLWQKEPWCHRRRRHHHHHHHHHHP